MVLRLFGFGKPRFQKFPDALSFWMANASLKPGPIEIGQSYVAQVLLALDRVEEGQVVIIRVAVLGRPSLEITVRVTNEQFGRNGKPLKTGDLVLWEPLHYMPEKGRILNTSKDPRADFFGYISAQVRPEMNLKTGEIAVVRKLPLPSK